MIRVLDKAEAINIINNVSSSKVFIMKYNTNDGISDNGEMVEKSIIYQWIEKSLLIQVINDFIMKMEIFDGTEIVLQLLLA